MLATMIPAAFASDLDGHWSKNFIEYLDDEGIINPSATTGKYEPERKVTRAEFMRYVNRAFHFTEKAVLRALEPLEFSADAHPFVVVVVVLLLHTVEHQVGVVPLQIAQRRAEDRVFRIHKGTKVHHTFPFF